MGLLKIVLDAMNRLDKSEKKAACNKATTKDIAQKEIEDWKRRSNEEYEEWKIAQEKKPPVDCRRLYDVDPIAFPFAIYEMVSDCTMAVDKLTGEIYESNRVYWLGSEGLISVLPRVWSLDIILDEAKQRFPSMPRLKMEIERALPVDSPDDLSECMESQRFAFLRYDPLTKTGRKAKYPLELSWTVSEREGVRDTSGGSISFLVSGKIGKADLHFNKDNVVYSVYCKTENEQLVLSRIVYSDEEIYKAWLYDRSRDKEL